MTYSEDYLEVRGSRACSGIGELVKDSGIQPRESNVVDDIVGNKAGPVGFPLRDSRSELSRITENVIQT